MPHRTMRSSSKTPASSRKKRDLSAEMVPILIDPAIVYALEVFQGKKPGTDSDTEMLNDPKVLRALTAFQGEIEGEKSIFASSTPIISSVISGGGEAVPVIPVEKIKKENTEKKGCGAKRKLADFASFSAIVKNTPKNKNKKTEGQSSVMFSAGSPTRGILSSQDATTADLLQYCDVKVEVMRRFDNCMKKTPTSSAKITKSLFETVSKNYQRKEPLTPVISCSSSIHVKHLIRILNVCCLFLSKQLRKMGRFACQEENNDHYNFFHILANYMVDMENVPNEKRLEEARAIIIGNISGDEKKFSRVRKVYFALSLHFVVFLFDLFQLF